MSVKINFKWLLQNLFLIFETFKLIVIPRSMGFTADTKVSRGRLKHIVIKLMVTFNNT